MVPYAIRESQENDEIPEEENGDEIERSPLRYVTEVEIKTSAAQGHLSVKLDQVRLRATPPTSAEKPKVS